MISMSRQNAREATEHELSSRLHFDDYRVFNRLHLTRVPDQFVDECLAGFLEDKSTTAAKERLQAIAYASRDKPEYEPPVEAIVDLEIGLEEPAPDRKAAESKMYDALVNISG